MVNSSIGELESNLVCVGERHMALHDDENDYLFSYDDHDVGVGGDDDGDVFVVDGNSSGINSMPMIGLGNGNKVKDGMS
ncbi:hypothetical protein BGX21_009943, partial [Mortierella sp. AD011]